MIIKAKNRQIAATDGLLNKSQKDHDPPEVRRGHAE